MEKQWQNMRIWRDTQKKLNRLKAILTLAGKEESGAAIVDRLVEQELQRVEPTVKAAPNPA